jgi:hypothetical protein
MVANISRSRYAGKLHTPTLESHRNTPTIAVVRLEREPVTFDAPPAVPHFEQVRRPPLQPERRVLR